MKVLSNITQNVYSSEWVICYTKTQYKIHFKDMWTNDWIKQEYFKTDISTLKYLKIVNG